MSKCPQDHTERIKAHWEPLTNFKWLGINILKYTLKQPKVSLCCNSYFSVDYKTKKQKLYHSPGFKIAYIKISSLLMVIYIRVFKIQTDNVLQMHEVNTNDFFITVKPKSYQPKW